MPDSDLLTIGVDLGGTKVETALVDSKGHIVAKKRRPTNPSQGSDAVIAEIVACVDECLGDASDRAEALGIGVAGQVDSRSGTVRFAPNLEWRDVPLKTKLEKVLGLPVVVTNDVRAATYGEWKHGAGKGAENLVCIFVGTGVGGGVINGGRMLEGCTNTAGELGHMTIVAGGRECRCRNRGCLEAYVGGWAIAQRAQEAARKQPRKGEKLLTLAGMIEQITAAHVGEAYSDGDALAHDLVDETARYLAAGLVAIVNTLNPCLIILGGGVVEGMPTLMERAEKIAKSRALEAALERVRFVKAALGGDAGSIGSAALVRDQILASGP